MNPDYCTPQNASRQPQAANSLVSLEDSGCLNQAASDSTNMDMLEKGLVQPEDL